MPIEQDPETGQIVSSSMTSERARELAEIRWKKTKDNDLAELLSGFGYTEENCPAEIKLLAEKAISTRGGNVTALTTLIKMHNSEEEKRNRKLDPEGDCPVCGSSPLGRKINEFIKDPKNARQLFELLGFSL